MMHDGMWWMPLMMWVPLLLIVALGIAVGYLWARQRDEPAERPASQAPSSRQAKQPSPGSSPTADEAPGIPTSSRELGKQLSDNEQAVYELVAQADAEGGVFQKDIPERTGMSKATVSRVLDRLERRGLVRRISHGMTNKLELADETRS